MYPGTGLGPPWVLRGSCPILSLAPAQFLASTLTASLRESHPHTESQREYSLAGKTKKNHTGS